MSELPAVPGILTTDDLAATVAAIVGLQDVDGNIRWVPGGHTDPWNLVEVAT